MLLRDELGEGSNVAGLALRAMQPLASGSKLLGAGAWSSIVVGQPDGVLDIGVRRVHRLEPRFLERGA